MLRCRGIDSVLRKKLEVLFIESNLSFEEILDPASGWLQNGSLVIKVEALRVWPCLVWAPMNPIMFWAGGSILESGYDWREEALPVFTFTVEEEEAAIDDLLEAASAAADINQVVLPCCTVLYFLHNQAMY